MKMKSMNDLFTHELKDLLSAEKQIIKALPKMIKAATNEDLRQALQDHLAETEEQATRLEEICEQLEIPLRTPKCKAMEGLIEEGKTAIEDAQDDAVRDAAIICSAQRVEHYEIAGYGCARTFAEQLGHQQIAELLQQTLEEEKAADEKLTQIATAEVNQEAAVG